MRALRRSGSTPAPPSDDDDPFVVYMHAPDEVLEYSGREQLRGAAGHSHVAIEFEEAVALDRSHVDAIAEAAAEAGAVSVTVRVARRA
jgi:hypothetical protein